MSTPRITDAAALSVAGHPARQAPRGQGRRPQDTAKAVCASLAGRLAAGAGAAALSLSLSACGLTVTGERPAALARISEPPTAPSVLVVITDPASPTALTTARNLVRATARPRERLLILDARGGALLAAAIAPAALSASVPGPPGRLPSGSTDYQKAQYLRAGRQYRSTVRRARAALGQRQEALLAVWARSAIAHLNARTLRSAPHAISMQAALATVAADFASLHEAGIDANSHSVIAVINPPAAAIATGPALSPELQDVSIVVSSFTGSSTAQTAWQNGLLQAGAGRVVLLTPATQGQLPPVVRQGLDGAVTDTLTSVLFASGKYRLQHGALPQLRRLQRLLTVTYPTATVSINGYTDNVPARIPGGNPELSRLRAQAVEAWLAGHGLTASRMQATSNGDADPLAPNTPRGQPLNRRVVVVIDPSTTK